MSFSDADDHLSASHCSQGILDTSFTTGLFLPRSRLRNASRPRPMVLLGRSTRSLGVMREHPEKRFTCEAAS